MGKVNVITWELNEDGVTGHRVNHVCDRLDTHNGFWVLLSNREEKFMEVINPNKTSVVSIEIYKERMEGK